MKQNVEIINTVDINEEYAILIVKKIKKPQKMCKGCPYLQYISNISRHYCKKYEGIVDATDFCIEEGM